MTKDERDALYRLFRIRTERDQLKAQIGALTGFLANGQPGYVDDAELARLHAQKRAMTDYLTVLEARIAAAEGE